MRDADHHGYFVFADKDTGRMRGWCHVTIQNAVNQPLVHNETIVRVARRPNMPADKFVDLVTGEMRSG